MTLVLNGVWAGLLEGIKSKTRGKKQVLGIYFFPKLKHQQQNDPTPFFLAPVCTLLGCNGFGLTECHVHHALWSGGLLDDKRQTAMDMKLGKMGEVLGR